MARLPTERIPFFRLSPAQAGQARCFGAQASDTLGKPINPNYHHPERIEALRSLAAASGQVRVAKLDDIADFVREQIKTPGENYLSLAHVESHTGELSEARGTASGACWSYKKGDVLFARLRPYLNKVYCAEMDGCCSTEFHVLRVKDAASISPSYLAAALRSRIVLAQTIHLMTGSTHPRLADDDVKELTVPIPATQRQLADAMANARAERKAKLAEAEALLSGLDDFVMSALGIAPPEADKRRVFAVPLDQLSRKHLNADYYHPERLAALRALAAAANEGELRVAPLDDLAEFARNQIKSPADNYLGLTHIASHTGELTGSEDVASGACWTFETGDVLFARLGSYLNKVYRAEMDGCCSTEFHVLRVKDGSALLPDYLAAALRSRLTLAQTVHMMTGNTHPRLTDDDVRALPIPVPPMPTQRRIVAETQRRRAEARRLRGEAEAGWVAARAGFEVGLLG